MVIGTQRRIVSNMLDVFVSRMLMLRYKSCVHCAQWWQVCPLWLRNVRFLPIFTSARWWQRFARTLNPLQTGWNPAKQICLSVRRMCLLCQFNQLPVRFPAISESSHLQAGCMAPAIFHVLTSVLVIVHSYPGLPQLTVVISIKWCPIAAICCFVAQCQFGGGGEGQRFQKKEEKEIWSDYRQPAQ